MESIIKNKRSGIHNMDCEKSSAEQLDPKFIQDVDVDVEGDGDDVEDKSDKGLKNFDENRRARTSRIVIYLYLFFQAFAYSASLRSLWPYLEKYGVNASKENLGWVFSLNQIGYFIMAPLIGWWSSKINSIRVPLVTCFFVAFFANCWYALLPLQSGESFFPSLLAEQFLIGISNTNQVLLITYLIQTSSFEDRTKSIAYFVLIQSIGYILGPYLQILLIKLGNDGFVLGFDGKLTLSMYTTTGWITALVFFCSILLFMSKFFHEANRHDSIEGGINASDANDNLLAKKSKLLSSDSKKSGEESIFSKYFTVFVIFFTYFTTSMHVTSFDTLATPLVMDLYGLNEESALSSVNIVSSVIAFVALGCYVIILLGPRLQDRNVLLFLGLFPLVCGRFFMFPIFGNSEAHRKVMGCSIENITLSTTHLNEGDLNETITQELQEISDGKYYKQDICDTLGLKWEILEHGCPEEQAWCRSGDHVHPYSLFAGLVISTIGYAFTYAYLQSIFTKLFANKFAALKMGTYNSVGSLEYMLGPVLFSFLYARHGVLALNGVIMSFEALSLILIILIFPKLKTKVQ